MHAAIDSIDRPSICGQPGPTTLDHSDITCIACRVTLGLDIPTAPAAPAAPATTTWLTVEVDEDGNLTVHDLTDGNEAEPIPTVMRPPTQWLDDLADAIHYLMVKAGMDMSPDA